MGHAVRRDERARPRGACLTRERRLDPDGLPTVYPRRAAHRASPSSRPREQQRTSPGGATMYEEAAMRSVTIPAFRPDSAEWIRVQGGPPFDYPIDYWYRVIDSRPD